MCQDRDRDPARTTFCIVPERREERTTEGGLGRGRAKETLREVVASLRSGGIRVSLFHDPHPHQIEAAAAVRSDAVELHTGGYAEASDP